MRNRPIFVVRRNRPIKSAKQGGFYFRRQKSADFPAKLAADWSTAFVDKMESNWDEQDVLSVIEFYELSPCLWNVTLKDYRNKDMKKEMEKKTCRKFAQIRENIFYQLGLN